MSAIPQYPVSDSVATGTKPFALPPALVYSAAAILGAGCILPSGNMLWLLWTQDALKSVGMFVPLISLVLILRAWAGLGWRTCTNWWGLALVLATTALGWVHLHSILLLVVSTQWTTALPPTSLPLLLYGMGAVLLLGGLPLLRATLFPVALLWFANPVPRAFSEQVDLPLQALSARIARSFAMHLGQPLTPDHLRLMFTPDFGMFIAPGCNGIRGSLTMALIALVAGHVYRFRWYIHAAVLAGAVLLGYLFNLLRLCLLVLYYIVALHLPWLKSRAEMGDYIIGAALFLIAAYLLFSAIHHLRRGAAASEQTDGSLYVAGERRRYIPAVALALTGVAAALAFLPAMTAQQTLIRPAADRFPTHLGAYKLVRTWQEKLDTGVVAYDWAEYVAASGTPVSLGVSPSLNWHDPIICHATRGEHPVWQGPLLASTAAQVPASFNMSLYADGVTRVLEASTQCLEGTCAEFATERTHFGFIYTPVNGSKRSLPVVIRAEQPVSGADDLAHSTLTQAIKSFVASVNLQDLTRP